MAKKKAVGGWEAGTRVRIKPDVTSPEFPDVSLAGWTGEIVEISGKPPAMKLVIEWDAATLSNLPADYKDRCESAQLYYPMACLDADHAEPLA